MLKNKQEAMQIILQEKLLETYEQAKKEYETQLKLKNNLEKSLLEKETLYNKVNEAHILVKDLEQEKIKSLEEQIKDYIKQINMCDEIIAFYKFNFGF